MENSHNLYPDKPAAAPFSETQGEKRGYWSPVLRYLIIALWGAALAGAVYYLLNKAGY